MGEIDAIGEAVSGAMLSGAIEPTAGGVGIDGHTHEQDCLNCGTRLQGDYCHACGQHSHVHRTLGAFWHDFLHGVLHFEGKAFRTLPMLIAKPGELTRRYVEGQRARFVSPLALFLFSVFMMFATLHALSGNVNLGKGSALGEAGQSIDETMAETRKEIASLERQQVNIPDAGREDVGDSLTEKRKDLAMLERMKKDGISSAIVTRAKDEGFSSDIPWIDAAIRKAKRNPQLLFYKLQTASYKYSWALIPISVPFLWLLFPFSRRFRLYDHAVFVTYSLSFMTLLVIAVSLWGWAGIGSIVIPLLLVPPVHMYLQLKGAYGLGRGGALWRTLFLSIFAFTALALFALLVLTLGVTD